MTVSIPNLPIVLQEAVFMISTLLLYHVILALLILVVYLLMGGETFVSEQYIRLKRKRDLTKVRTARTPSKDGNFGDALDLIRDRC
jgi:hypothetical protein